jgi:hypothetical protein
MEIMAAAAIEALPRRHGKSAKNLDLTDFRAAAIADRPQRLVQSELDSSIAELAPDAGPSGPSGHPFRRLRLRASRRHLRFDS